MFRGSVWGASFVRPVKYIQAAAVVCQIMDACGLMVDVDWWMLMMVVDRWSAEADRLGIGGGGRRGAEPRPGCWWNLAFVVVLHRHGGWQLIIKGCDGCEINLRG
jgi:hypothetical protein